MAKKRIESRICASISADSLDEMALKAQSALYLKADLVEFRIDSLTGRFTVADMATKLGKYARVSVLTLRPKREGGKFFGSEIERMGLISEFATLRPAYIDVELSTAKENAKWFRTLSKKTEKIISWHDLEGTPDIMTLRSVCKEELELGGVAKVVTTAKAMEDNVRTLTLCSENEGRVVSFCMGELGVASRILSMQMGAPLVYASLPNDAVAPGQLAVPTMLEFRGLVSKDD